MIEAIIKEGGTTRVFANRAKLEVSLQGGGTTFFVPESETRLTTKRIEKNGVYKASDDGDYGWSTVTVAVSTTDSVTGTGADGKEHNYSVDGSGALVDQVVPSEIRITTQPNTLEYSDGAAIDFTGIVVHAYDSLGGDMGAVPFNELVFPVTVAEYDPDAKGQATYDGSTVFYNSNGGHEDYEKGNYEYVTTLSVTGGKAYFLKNKDGFPLVYFTDENTVVEAVQTEFYNGSVMEYRSTEIKADNSSVAQTTAGGVTYYYKIIAYQTHAYTISNDLLPINEYTTLEIGDILFDGARIDNAQEIPVEWSRTGDGLVLDTSFEISVSAPVSYGGATGGGGSTSGGGAGRN